MSIKKNQQQTIDEESYWQGLCNEWESSNESQASFCKARQISYHQFTYMRSKLRVNLITKNTEPKFVPVKVEKPKTNTQDLLKSSSLQLHLPQGLTLNITPNCDMQFLQKVVFALASPAGVK